MDQEILHLTHLQILITPLTLTLTLHWLYLEFLIISATLLQGIQFVVEEHILAKILLFHYN